MPELITCSAKSVGAYPRLSAGERLSIERVLEVRQRRPLRAVEHGDDVEARRLRGPAPLREVIAGGGDHPPLLARVYRLLRAAEDRRRTGAHFDEHEQLALLCDDVDFAEPATVVARDDPVAAGAQESGGGLFTQRAETRFRHACSTRSAVPVAGASATRWMTCVCVPMPLSIFPISARLEASRIPNASSMITGSRL